jgi:hypothetical protein
VDTLAKKFLNKYFKDIAIKLMDLNDKILTRLYAYFKDLMGSLSPTSLNIELSLLFPLDFSCSTSLCVAVPE